MSTFSLCHFLWFDEREREREKGKGKEKKGLWGLWADRGEEGSGHRQNKEKTAVSVADFKVGPIFGPCFTSKYTFF